MSGERRSLVWGPQSARGLLVLLVGLGLDQAVKLWLLYGVDLDAVGPIQLAAFAEIRLIWNFGISYGLFQQNSDLGRWLLVGLTVAAVALLWAWLARSRSALVAISLGLIAGGAIGNGIDRAWHGAVVDFVHLFMPDRSLSWYVFNLADAWIVAGVAGLLYDSLTSGPTEATKSRSS